jgi:hypothetical protein
MNKVLIVVAGALLLGAVTGVAAAGAGAEVVSENRAVDARVTRVRLDGLVDLQLRQGAVPSLVVSGDTRWVGQTTTRQSGDTLVISNGDEHVSGSNRRGLRVDLVLPMLRELVSESLGKSDVSGFNGDHINVALDGAGAMSMRGSNYRVVKVTLGGLGSMNLQGLSADLVELNLEGAGFVTLAGQARVLRANMEGLGNLDAKQFMAQTVNVDLSGLGSATVNAHQNINLNLSGLGSVTVYGKPLNRKVSVDGLGKVSWK